MSDPPLRPLHNETCLIESKLEKFRKLGPEEIIESLRPGQPGALKARPDGTVLDGHHRLRVLCERCFDIDILPREILPKDRPGKGRR